jgi:hypothetical protein
VDFSPFERPRLLTIMGVMIITIFLKLIWHSCRRESKEMSHGRRAVRYQCPSRDDESNDYVESEGQCGPYQEPQGFGRVPVYAWHSHRCSFVGTEGIGVTSCDAKGSWITCSLRVPYFHSGSISLG